MYILFVWLVTQISLTCFDVGNSYIAYWLPKVFRLQQRFWTADMTPDSKVKVKNLKICLHGL